MSRTPPFSELWGPLAPWKPYPTCRNCASGFLQILRAQALIRNSLFFV